MIPVGIGLYMIFSRRKNKFRIVLLAGLWIFTMIEILQLVMVKGLCDIKNIIYNTIGTTIGILCYRIVEKLITR